jgi:hypothetical protein
MFASCVATSTCVFTLCPSIAAQESMTAQVLFDEGRALLERNEVDAACEKFEASHNLEHAFGTLINLGECNNRRGRTASAWLNFRSAASIASKKGEREREEHAAKRAQALEQHLCRLTVTAPRGAMVTRNGTPVPEASYGIAVPVDPGAYRIEAGTFLQQIVFVPDAAGCIDKVVQIPASALPAPLRHERVGVVTAPMPSATPSMALISGSIGVATLIPASAFAIWGLRQRSDLGCESAAVGCASSDASSVRTKLIVADIFFSVSAVGLVTCAVLLLLSKGEPRRVSLSDGTLRF